MKKNFTQFWFGAMLAMSVTAQAQDGLFISEVTDPADEYTGRFIELFNAGSEKVDFNSLTFYLSRQSNGGTSWGDVKLTGIVGAGETYVIGGSAFETLYGFSPDLVTGILIGNGDDAYCVFRDGDHNTGVLHDIYGAIDTDGTGEPWEYEDSRAVRVETVTVPNTIWTADEWVIMSAGIADCDPGTHHGSTTNDTVPEPGNYSLTVPDHTVQGGGMVEITISVSEIIPSDNIISYQFDLEYNPSMLEYTGHSVAGTIAEGGTVVINTGMTGKLSVGYMNSTVLAGSGAILILQFNSLVLGTTELILSNAWLNNIPVLNLTHGTIIIAEDEPPTAVLTYNDTVNRYADTLIITATFSEPMDASIPVRISLSGAVILSDAGMSRLNDTVYNYLYQIPKADGEVTVRLTSGADLWGNGVVPVPQQGSAFNIIRFFPGDVDDDGIVLAYDAALTLQHSVGIDPLPDIDPLPWEPWRDSTANVDGTGGITAYDAGLILQYSIGIITDFFTGCKKSAPAAEVTVEVVGNEIVFYSYGELLGLNISATNTHRVLGAPVFLADNILTALNIDGTVYKIGLCTAFPLSDGIPFMKLPFKRTGFVTFNMMVNTGERKITIDLTSGLVEPVNTDIEIYPNPVSDKLNIRGLTGPAVAGIFNVHGKLILTTHTEGPAMEIDLSDLSAGFYILRVETDRETLVKRFLME